MTKHTKSGVCKFSDRPPHVQGFLSAKQIDAAEQAVTEFMHTPTLKHAPVPEGTALFAVVRYPSMICRVQRLIVGPNGKAIEYVSGRIVFEGRPAYRDYHKANAEAHRRTTQHLKSALKWRDEILPEMIARNARDVQRLQNPTRLEWTGGAR